MKRGADAGHRAARRHRRHRDACGAPRSAPTATRIHSFVARERLRRPVPARLRSRATSRGPTPASCGSTTSSATSSSGEMDDWVDLYARVLGFKRYISFDDKDISTEYCALMCMVMSDDSLRDQVPDQRAGGRASARARSTSTWSSTAAPACSTSRCRRATSSKTVTALRDQGVEFLRVPASYYDQLPARVGEIDEALETVRALGILVDRDDEGYLLQIFTKPGRGSADALLRDHPAEGQPRLRQGQLQGALRGDRAGTGAAGGNSVGCRQCPGRSLACHGSPCPSTTSSGRFRASGTSCSGRRRAASTPRS